MHTQPVPLYFLPHDLTIEPYLGSSAYGATYGGAYTRKAHVRQKRRILQKADGVEVVCTMQAYVAPSPRMTLAIESRVTYQGVTYRVVDIAYLDSYTLLSLAP